MSTDTSSIASHDDTPLLFISHRHADREIADVVRKFINYQSRDDVKVYQTSSADAEAPKIGRNISRELMNALWKSQVLMLIYTGADRDWDYCMWSAASRRKPTATTRTSSCCSAAASCRACSPIRSRSTSAIATRSSAS